MFLPMSWTSPLTVAIRMRAAGPLGGLAGGGFLLLHERHQVGHRLLHHAGRLDHLRQEHLAGGEQVADLGHAGHQRAFDDVQAALVMLPSLFHVLLDELVDALDQGVDQPLFDGARVPAELRLPAPSCPAI